MRVLEKLKNLSKIEIIVLVISAMLFLVLIYRITFDIAYNQTISNYLDVTGR